ncbi:MAG TPA: type VI secretion system tube protein Hcp [Pantoea septica]|nr:type VI secretion system tube protein Hcp [Pantoea septica]
MAIPAYLWLEDDGGTDIKGSMDVQDPTGSIEVLSFIHGLGIPSAPRNGKLTGTRIHNALNFEKEFDSTSLYLYKSVSSGQTLKSAEIKWYRINYAVQEVECFNILLEGVKVVSVSPLMHNIKTIEKMNHLESVTLRYERITWKYCDGNIQHSDSWKERA